MIHWHKKLSFHLKAMTLKTNLMALAAFLFFYMCPNTGMHAYTHQRKIFDICPAPLPQLSGEPLCLSAECRVRQHYWFPVITAGTLVNQSGRRPSGSQSVSELTSTSGYLSTTCSITKSFALEDIGSILVKPWKLWRFSGSVLVSNLVSCILWTKDKYTTYIKYFVHSVCSIKILFIQFNHAYLNYYHHMFISTRCCTWCTVIAVSCFSVSC